MKVLWIGEGAARRLLFEAERPEELEVLCDLSGRGQAPSPLVGGVDGIQWGALPPGPETGLRFGLGAAMRQAWAVTWRPPSLLELQRADAGKQIACGLMKLARVVDAERQGQGALPATGVAAVQGEA